MTYRFLGLLALAGLACGALIADSWADCLQQAAASQTGYGSITITDCGGGGSGPTCTCEVWTYEWDCVPGTKDCIEAEAIFHIHRGENCNVNTSSCESCDDEILQPNGKANLSCD
ncbi:MAG: hypothetical protein KDB73_07075 [Planctomycetes bacterium]|nr:hypothetical protein [Planctomycetota bacterium]